MSREKDILGGRGREERDVGWEGRDEEEKLFTYLYLFIYHLQSGWFPKNYVEVMGSTQRKKSGSPMPLSPGVCVCVCMCVWCVCVCVCVCVCMCMCMCVSMHACQ